MLITFRVSQWQTLYEISKSEPWDSLKEKIVQAIGECPVSTYDLKRIELNPEEVRQVFDYAIDIHKHLTRISTW